MGHMRYMRTKPAPKEAECCRCGYRWIRKQRYFTNPCPECKYKEWEHPDRLTPALKAAYDERKAREIEKANLIAGQQ